MLTAALRDDIRFETNYAYYFDSLMVINRPRFRGLGDDHCRTFVAHAARLGDAMGFETLGSVSYLMFLMHWLGSHFHEDPRHAALNAALTSSAGEEERIDHARDIFIAFAQRHIGETGEIYHDRLAALHGIEPYLTDTTSSHHALHDALLDAFHMQGDARTAYPRDAIEAAAVASARALSIDTPLGRRICLVLTFLLGTRIHADPLFPWIRDITAKARTEGQAADEALLAYAQKRRAATLRDAEAVDV
jgi:hypothetical protein